MKKPKYKLFVEFLKPLSYSEICLLILCAVIHLRDNKKYNKFEDDFSQDGHNEKELAQDHIEYIADLGKGD